MSEILNLKVAASHDDAHELEDAGYMDLEGDNLLFFAGDNMYNRWWPAMRFIPEEPIPQGATILAAYLKVKATEEAPNDTNVNLHFEKAAAPTGFLEDAFDISSRPRTDVSIPWIADAVGQGWVNSPSLVDALQELVNAYQVSTLVVISRPNQDVEKQLVTNCYDTVPEDAPELYIEYEVVVVVEPTPQTNAADTVAATSAKLHGLLTNDGGEACSVRFEYGIKPALNQQTNWQEGFVTNDPYEASAEGLLPETTYVFRAVAENSAGQGEGETLEFTTLALPPQAANLKKVLVTHPAIKSVAIIQDGSEATKYENLSNLDEQRIEDAIEFPVLAPATIKVTTLSNEVWTFDIAA